MKMFRLNKHSVRRMLMVSSVAVLLMGCATPKFSCTDDMTGPGCRSVSQVYANAHQQHAEPPDSPTGMPAIIRPGDPIRSGERVLRVWMAPWVDVDGDYHDQTYVYLVLDHGRWYIDRARGSIRKHFAPRVIPPAKNSGQQASRAAASAKPEAHQ